MIRITEIYWKSASMWSGSLPFAMYHVSGQLCLKIVFSGRKGLTTILKHCLYWWPTKAAGSQPALLETHRQKDPKWSSEAHFSSRHGISSVGAFPLVCFYIFTHPGAGDSTAGTAHALHSLHEDVSFSFSCDLKFPYSLEAFPPQPGEVGQIVLFLFHSLLWIWGLLSLRSFPSD